MQGGRRLSPSLSIYKSTSVNLPNNSHGYLHLSRRLASSATPSSEPELPLSQQNEHRNNKGAQLCDWWWELRQQSQLNQFYLAAHQKQEHASALEKDQELDTVLESDHEPATTLERDQEPAQALPNGLCPNRCVLKAKNIVSPKSKRRLTPLTPTQYLINALRNAGYKLDNVEFRDLKISSSRTVTGQSIPPSVVRKKRPDRRCLQAILADYIQFVGPLLTRIGEPEAGRNNSAESDLDNALGEAFSYENVQYLEARGYNVADVVAWAWIFQSDTTHGAVLRMLALEEENRKTHGSGAHGVPYFIPLFLLRTQRRLNTKAFHLLLTYSLHLISNPGQASNTTGTSVDLNMHMLFAETLLHRAREVWPQAQLDIARAFSTYLTHPENEKDRYKTKRSNELLALLSLPTNQSPFRSASIQQQAQFEVLKAMAGQTPVLPVTRQGYRGIIAVQLAHKKTPAERETAEMKAPTWPPWKEERLGIDFERGNEGMKSRAMQVVNQMKHAGYSLSSWETVASILAGWDTDESPTIQTRGMMHRTSTSPLPVEQEPDYTSIWLARIRATRTLREAWACFLSYQDLDLPPYRSIYTAMAEKLLYRGKAVRYKLDYASHLLPGDGPEVSSEPFSARDVIYVHTKPPTLDEFLKQMLSQGIRPSGRLLSLLLRSAPTFRHGLDYICCSDLSNCQIQVLCSVRGGQSKYNVQDQKILDDIPNHVFSAFVEFLCRFSRLDKYLVRSDIHMADTFPIILGARDTTETTTLFDFQERGLEDMISYPKILSHVVELVRLRGSRSPQPWIRLLSGLNKHRVSLRYRIMSTNVQLVLAWQELVEVVGLMNERDIEPGLIGLQVLCRAFIKAVTVTINDPDAAEKALELVEDAARRKHVVHTGPVSRTPEDLVQNGLRVLKNVFEQLVLFDPNASQMIDGAVELEDLSDPQITTSPMPCAPTPAVLHVFVRALGIAEDYDGLMSLLRWMKQAAPALKEGSDESQGAERIMRRTMVAIRVFLERPWEKTHFGSSDLEPLEPNSDESPIFTDPNLQEAYEIFEATPLLGPWPSDEEVLEYIEGWSD